MRLAHVDIGGHFPSFNVRELLYTALIICCKQNTKSIFTQILRDKNKVKIKFFAQNFIMIDAFIILGIFIIYCLHLVYVS